MTGNTLVPGKASETELCRMMDEYSSMLVGICAILLDDRDLAQDVVQETFIRVYKKMDSFRGARPESEKAWLTRIAVNLCRDEKRKSWFRLRERAKPIDMTAIPMEDATEGYRQVLCANSFTSLAELSLHRAGKPALNYLVAEDRERVKGGEAACEALDVNSVFCYQPASSSCISMYFMLMYFFPPHWVPAT